MIKIRAFLIRVQVFFIDEGIFRGDGFRSLRVKTEAFGGGIKTGHQLPRVDDFRLGFGPGFRDGCGKDREEGDTGWSGGGDGGFGGRWVKTQEAVSGGGEGNDMVAQG